MEINDYPNYLIYEDGRVWSKTTNKFLKPSYNKDGYLRLGLSNNKKRKFLLIHRLIALHYIPNPNNYPTVDHINRIPDDNRIENLRWANCSEQSLNRIMPPSNTGEKYISIINITKWKYYLIEKSNCFRKYLNCSKYTLQDAINLRDSFLIEYNIVEPSV